MTCGINAGRLSQRVTLQQRTAGVDALGQELTTWSDVATLWAEVQPLRGREYFAAGQLQSAVDVRVRIRWRAGVVPTMRVVWRGEPMEIVSVIEPDAAKVSLELMCVSGVRDGR